MCPRSEELMIAMKVGHTVYWNAHLIAVLGTTLTRE